MTKDEAIQYLTAWLQQREKITSEHDWPESDLLGDAVKCLLEDQKTEV